VELLSHLPVELIRKKRFGGAHTQDELRALLSGYLQNHIHDYQMAAWLMAVCFQGMTDEEMTAFTEEMSRSGTQLDFSHLGACVDKHSTGGLGDKTSLILAPLVAAAGVTVPMMAGRGLGHTGGTLDKLESLHGFRVNLTLAEFADQLRRVGTAIIGQTEEICPADRKLYALRDVTGTVDCLPLICASIMSKKLAEGISALVLDVKWGSGAFMKTLADAERLANALVRIGKQAGKSVHALVTNMNEPLGRFVGNALEVQECLDIMEGSQKYDNTRTLCLELAGHMIHLAGKATTVAAGKQIAQQLLEDGSALRKFHELCVAQGGAPHVPLRKARRQLPVLADKSGFINYGNLEALGYAAIRLGAGRARQTDVIDPATGIEVHVRQGQSIKQGEPLVVLHVNDESHLAAAEHNVRQAIQVTDEYRAPYPLIAKVIT